MKNKACQSMSIDELFEDYKIQIEVQAKALKGAIQRETNLMHELSRIAELLKQSKYTEGQAVTRAEEAERIVDKLKEQFEEGEANIKNLKDQIVIANQTISTGTIQNKRLETIIVRLKAEEKELKKQKADLEQQIEDLKDATVMSTEEQ